MNGKATLYIDQWNNRYWAKTVKGLRKQIGGGGSAVRKMYCDKKDGSIVHTGYVIGEHWLEAYQRVELLV
jgi:hypothetical protein